MPVTGKIIGYDPGGNDHHGRTVALLLAVIAEPAVAADGLSIRVFRGMKSLHSDSAAERVELSDASII
jgi:hypothetical protein